MLIYDKVIYLFCGWNKLNFVFCMCLIVFFDFSYLLMKINFCYKNLDILWLKKKKSWKCWKYNYKDVIRWILNVLRVCKNYVYVFKFVMRVFVKIVVFIDKLSVVYRNFIYFVDLWCLVTF